MQDNIATIYTMAPTLLQVALLMAAGVVACNADCPDADIRCRIAVANTGQSVRFHMLLFYARTCTTDTSPTPGWSGVSVPMRVPMM